MNSQQPVIYLIRHATPDWSRTDIPYHIPPGPPLSPQGLEEAKQLAEFFSQNDIRLVYASPLERCLHTARIASQGNSDPVEIVGALRELQPGELSRDILARTWPVFLTAWENSRRYGRAALVTHGGVIAVLLEHLGITPQSLRKLSTFDHNNPIPPAGAWRIAQASDGTWEKELVFQPGVKAPGD